MSTDAADVIIIYTYSWYGDCRYSFIDDNSFFKRPIDR